MKKYFLTFDSIGKQERSEAIKSLISGKYTMGNKVKQFENLFAKLLQNGGA